MLELSRQPEGDRRLGDFLLRNLACVEWTEFNAAVAFVRRSGTQYLKAPLAEFLARGGRASISVGVDLKGTTREGLEDLLDVLGERGEAWVVHNETHSTFHPKMYVFSGDGRADVYVGSGNLTEGGLFTNYEVGFQATLDLTVDHDRRIHDQLLQALAAWSDPESKTTKRLTRAQVEELVGHGYVVAERDVSGTEDEATGDGGFGGGGRTRLFGMVAVQRPPRVREPRPARPEPVDPPGQPTGFVMTLQRTDVGTGQVTAGTSRRSPEIFIPLAARDLYPAFWGYPDLFREDPAKEGKHDRVGVRMRIANRIVTVNMMTWPDKHDFRLRSEALRSAGNIGDILRVEHAPVDVDFDYDVAVISRDSGEYRHFAAICKHSVRNSEKTFGYY